MPGVLLQRVTKVHRVARGGEVVALREVSLEVERGECVVVVGPSGSGKTTLLRGIAGLEEPTSGTIDVGGRSMRGVPSRERGMAMVFQDHPLFPHLDVAGNLALGLTLRKVSKSDQAERLEEVVAWLGLRALLDRMPGTLSGGERQRVALGMALVQRPQVLLLDEPLAHLDARWRLQLRREFRTLQRRLGLTWIQVTHDQSEALALADRLVVLESGAVQQVGTPAEVYGRPANRFVAEFLGSPGMNLLTGRRVESGEGGWPLVGGEGGAPGPTGGAASRVTMGFRPEVVRLESGGAPGTVGAAWMTTSGEVSVVESMGHEAWVHVRMGGGSWVVARVSGGVPWQPGNPVRVMVPCDAVHWFDAVTGSRVE